MKEYGDILKDAEEIIRQKTYPVLNDIMDSNFGFSVLYWIGTLKGCMYGLRCWDAFLEAMEKNDEDWSIELFMELREVFDSVKKELGAVFERIEGAIESSDD